MTAKLVITLSDDAVAALRSNKSISVRVTAGKAAAEGEAREGSLPARVVSWAKSSRKEFGTKDVTKQFKLSRAHASMLLSRLAGGGFPIRRKRRGLYAYKG